MPSEKRWVDYVPKNAEHFTHFPSSPGSTLHTGKVTFSSLETHLRTPWLVSKARFVVTDEAGIGQHGHLNTGGGGCEGGSAAARVEVWQKAAP